MSNNPRRHRLGRHHEFAGTTRFSGQAANERLGYCVTDTHREDPMPARACLLGDGFPAAYLAIGDQKEIAAGRLGCYFVANVERCFDIGATQICFKLFAEGLQLLDITRGAGKQLLAERLLG